MTRMNWRRLAWEKRVSDYGEQSRGFRKGHGKRDTLGEIAEALDRAERERAERERLERERAEQERPQRFRRRRRTHKIRRFGT